MDVIPDASALGWWICGPAEYTKPILPKSAKAGEGFVYAVLTENGLVKVGCTGQPRQRLTILAGHLRIYGPAPARVVALSHPMGRHKEAEAKIHEAFGGCRVVGEFFRCSLAEVANVLATGQAGRRVVRRRPGRPPRPWLRASNNCWYTQIDGGQIFLGRTKAEADRRLAVVMMERGQWDDSLIPGIGANGGDGTSGSTESKSC